MNTDVGSENYALANMISEYNSYVRIHDDINQAKYFGYKLTQWLLSEVEKCTIIIPKYDAYAKQRVILRGRLRSVQCDVSHSAIKTIFSTDVLLDMVRKTYIDPWGLIYPYGDVSKLPPKLKEYSLKGDSIYPTWANKTKMNDKQVSVILESKHMVRFEFHAFRRKFHGADPVVASKQIEKMASTGKRMSKKARKVQIETLEAALTPKRSSVKQWLRNATLDAAGGGKTPFPGAAVGGSISNRRYHGIAWKNPWK